MLKIYLGSPGVLGIWGEWLFIFREQGSSGNYFQGFGEQAHSLEFSEPCTKVKKSHLKAKAFILFEIIGPQTPPPLGNLNVFTYVLTCKSRLVFVTVMANTFYYCGKLSLKLLIFRSIIVFGALRMYQIAPF